MAPRERGMCKTAWQKFWSRRLADGPLYMGKDTHALSGPAQRTALEVLAANGVETIIQRDDSVTPTPVSSSFALHQALAEVFPGRFNAVSPAAVELHCTMDVLQDAPITIVLSPDTDAEHDYLPEPETLKGDVFLADRGYLDLAYLRDLDRHGGFFIVRGKAGLNPHVIDAFREDGKRIKSCQGVIRSLPGSGGCGGGSLPCLPRCMSLRSDVHSATRHNA